MSSVVVLITGANSGVGYATTKVLAASASPSYHIIMTGRSISKVHTARSEILSLYDVKGTLSALELDVTSEESIKKAAEVVEEQHGHLDALINNAAVGARDSDIKTRMQSSMDTNVIGPAVVASVFRPLLLKAAKPYSVYVSSGAGSLTRASQPSPHQISNDEAYRASKAALNMLAVHEHKNYGEKGLKVFTFCPGFVVSNLRGTDEYSRNGWGHNAGDPDVAGQTIMSILQGERDADAGKFVHKDGIYPW